MYYNEETYFCFIQNQLILHFQLFLISPYPPYQTKEHIVMLLQDKTLSINESLTKQKEWKNCQRQERILVSINWDLRW